MKYFFLLDKHLPEGVGIAFFGPEHIAWLLGSVVLCLLLCSFYRRSNASARYRLGLSVAVIIFLLEMFRIAAQIIAGVFTVHYLPFHLCGLAVYFTLIHSFSNNSLMGEVIYAFGVPGAVSALVFPDWLHYPLLNIQSIQSFLIHALLFSYPIMRVYGGDIRPSIKRLPACLLFISAFAIPLFIFNKICGTNFFFLNWPSPGSPLEFFYTFLGNPGYIAGYIPLLLVVWIVLYAPFNIPRRHR